MKLIGIAIEIKNDYQTKKPNCIVTKEVIDVEKETSKIYKVSRGSLIFNCLSNIPKDDLWKIQKKEWAYQLEHKIWLIEGELQETEIINILKLSLKSEMVSRQDFNNETLNQLKMIHSS
jgi:hypothetical protein